MTSGWEDRRHFFEQEMNKYLNSIGWDQDSGVQELKKSIFYSTTRGGKRFRPILSFLVSESLGVGPQRVCGLAIAIEMIHSYSLIHDDLPCMDNDDERRGEPTNHKVFGDATALLAGDALGTEAFRALSRTYVKEPEVGLALVDLLAEAAGCTGMVAGQAIDLRAQDQQVDLSTLERMHRMKTGALIRIACEGAAVACGVPTAKQKLFREFGENLGLAFQVADDLLDSCEESIEQHSYPGVIGLEKTKEYLQELTAHCSSLLKKLAIPETDALHALLQYNATRKH